MGHDSTVECPHPPGLPVASWLGHCEVTKLLLLSSPAHHTLIDHQSVFPGPELPAGIPDPGDHVACFSRPVLRPPTMVFSHGAKAHVG